MKSLHNPTHHTSSLTTPFHHNLSPFQHSPIPTLHTPVQLVQSLHFPSTIHPPITGKTSIHGFVHTGSPVQAGHSAVHNPTTFHGSQHIDLTQPPSFNVHHGVHHDPLNHGVPHEAIHLGVHHEPILHGVHHEPIHNVHAQFEHHGPHHNIHFHDEPLVAVHNLQHVPGHPFHGPPHTGMFRILPDFSYVCQ